LKMIMAAIALFAVGSIVLLAFNARRARWRQRWQEYRFLTQNLSSGWFLALVGEVGRISDARRDGPGTEQTWTLWYYRATMREIALPNARLDSSYQFRVLNATAERQILLNQLFYRARSQESSRMDEALRIVATLCLAITFFVWAGVLSCYAIQLSISHSVGGQILLATTTLPALALASMGIRVQGEFTQDCDRAAAMLDALAALEAEFQAALRGEPHLGDTGDLLLNAARIMSEDVVAAQRLYGRRRLSLPA
jgi:hypothetical protein